MPSVPGQASESTPPVGCLWNRDTTLVGMDICTVAYRAVQTCGGNKGITISHLSCSPWPVTPFLYLAFVLPRLSFPPFLIPLPQCTHIRTHSHIHTLFVYTGILFYTRLPIASHLVEKQFCLILKVLGSKISIWCRAKAAIYSTTQVLGFCFCFFF